MAAMPERKRAHVANSDSNKSSSARGDQDQISRCWRSIREDEEDIICIFFKTTKQKKATTIPIFMSVFLFFQ